MRRDVFQAIADPVRREIIALLADEVLSINAIAERFAISRPAISKHLKILNECGIVHFQKKGRERYCEIQPKSLLPVSLWIEQYRKLWEDKLDSFETYIMQLQTKNKAEMNDLAKRTLSIQRTFDAPLQLVWDAWTQAAHIAHWWGPKGMPVTIVKHDFKVGGEWEYAMKMPNGGDFISEGRFTAIIPLEKITTTANFRPMTEGVELQLLFEADGEKTHFTFHCVHPTEEYRIQQEQMGFYNGWEGTFERLAAYLREVN